VLNNVLVGTTPPVSAVVTFLNIVRAARHGHRMNGKLARLAQQEAGESSTQKSGVPGDVGSGVPAERCQQKCTKSKKKKKKKLKRTTLEDS